jgi:hypothetical protein
MQPNRRHSLHRFIFALGLALPGFLGILVAQAKILGGQSGIIEAALQTAGPASATAAPIQATVTAPFQTSNSSPQLGLPTSAGSPSSSLYAFIEAPKGPVPQPFVILSAFSSRSEAVTVAIRGFVNSDEFFCPQSPCAVDLQTSARIVFAAYADSGESGATVIASVSVTQSDNGYLVTVDSVNQFSLFNNACSNAWGVFDTAGVTWDDFVQFPYKLHTRKTLHTLATQLLVNGVAEAKDCPSGGLSVGLNWPTACGLERASSAMISWQNQYDNFIWLASKDQGIPPKILKTLIEIETQFWPGNARFYLDEFGLGQVNQLGLDVLLRHDPDLYQRVCPGLLSDCTRPYLSLAPEQQAMIRGAAVRLMDASCATCKNGFDLNKARESIPLIAMLFKANCQQVDAILNVVVQPDADVDAATATAAAATLAAGDTTATTGYEDLWRFTFLSYHSGLNCLQEAVIATKKAKFPLTWKNVEERLKCKGGADYVNGFMNNLLAFDLYLLDSTDTSVVMAAPTIIATRTPLPTPTVYVSSAKVRVQVYIDRNGNNSPDVGEWIDGMTVLLETSTNQQITQRTQNGITVFDMSGYTPGIGINVSLPGLYRNEGFELPQQGVVPVTFKFEQPQLPTTIP